MTSRIRRLEKVLRYHHPLAATDPDAAMRSAAEHWRGFTWRCGPYIVKWARDDLPELQVWAESTAEGIRVLSHALAHIGEDPASGEFYSSEVVNKRNGKIGSVVATMVSARPGPQGITPHLPIL